MIKLHPAIVHFPMALLVLAGLLAVISVFAKAKKEEWKDALIKILVTGTAFAALAFITGLIEEDSLPHNDAVHQTMMIHKYNGLGIFFLFSGIVIWYWLRRKEMGSKEYKSWALSIMVGALLVLGQGYLGGEMVFTYGTGVKPVEEMMEGGVGHGHADGGNDMKGMKGSENMKQGEEIKDQSDMSGMQHSNEKQEGLKKKDLMNGMKSMDGNNMHRMEDPKKKDQMKDMDGMKGHQMQGTGHSTHESNMNGMNMQDMQSKNPMDTFKFEDNNPAMKAKKDNHQ